MCTLSKLKSKIEKIQTELLTKVQLELLWCEYLKLVDELNDLIESQGKNLFSDQFYSISASIKVNLNKQQWMSDEWMYHNNLRLEYSRLINLHEGVIMMENSEMYKVVRGGNFPPDNDYSMDRLKLKIESWMAPYTGVLILDCDGCIRNGKHRLSLLPTPEEVAAAGDEPNIAFTKFNEMCHLDTPIFDVINVANMFKARGYFTVILTSCIHSSHTLDTLLKQLHEWGVVHDVVVMRGVDNHLHPVEFKEQFLYDSGIATSTIKNVVALDDCLKNCNMFREYGILALQTEDYSRYNKGDTK